MRDKVRDTLIRFKRLWIGLAVGGIVLGGALQQLQLRLVETFLLVL